MRLIYHPHAENELIEAARYYESRVPTLGVQFLDEANRAVAMMLDTPRRWRIIEDNIRSYLMPRFPYAIYYRDFPDRLHILAFKHHGDTLITGDIAFPSEAPALYSTSLIHS